MFVKYSIFLRTQDRLLQINENKKTGRFILFEIDKENKNWTTNEEKYGFKRERTVTYSTQKPIQKKPLRRKSCWRERSLKFSLPVETLPCILQRLCGRLVLDCFGRYS